MASYYVYSGAAGAGTGTNWANAYTTVALAISGKSAGDVFYLAHDHAESTAGDCFFNAPGTHASPCRFLCVDRGGSVPPVSADLRTTASIATTGSGTTIYIGSGSDYWYGVNFSAGTGGNSYISTPFFAGTAAYMTACHFKLGGTGGNISLGGLGQLLRWTDCTVEFSNTAQSINQMGVNWEWRDTASAVVGATIPSSLIGAANESGTTLVEGVDLSAIGSGATLYYQNNSGARAVFKDCKVSATATLTAAPGAPNMFADFIRCDSGATNYRTERYRYEGTLTTETTIVRTGGASDGTTPIAWKIVTTANSEWIVPFECFPISIFNRTVGVPVTVTVQGIWGGGAVPLNDEIWMDVEYLGSALNPQGSFATTTKADILATGANLPAGSGTWGGSTTKFALTATVTPQMEGPIWVTVKMAKVSSTFYIDPKITLS